MATIGAECSTGWGELTQIDAVDLLARCHIPKVQLVGIVIRREQVAAVGRDSDPDHFADGHRTGGLACLCSGPRAGWSCQGCSRPRSCHRAKSSRRRPGRCARQIVGRSFRCLHPRGSRSYRHRSGPGVHRAKRPRQTRGPCGLPACAAPRPIPGPIRGRRHRCRLSKGRARHLSSRRVGHPAKRPH